MQCADVAVVGHCDGHEGLACHGGIYQAHKCVNIVVIGSDYVRLCCGDVGCCGVTEHGGMMTRMGWHTVVTWWPWLAEMGRGSKGTGILCQCDIQQVYAPCNVHTLGFEPKGWCGGTARVAH